MSDSDLLISDDLDEPIDAKADEATIDDDDDDEDDESAKVAEAEIISPKSFSIEPNTYNIKPELPEKFRGLIVKTVIHEVLTEELSGKVYSAELAKEWSTNIANIINRKVREMKWKRYKHIVQVIIGEQRGAGFKSGVKCVWDSETDNYTSDMFVNDTMFCVVAVFAIYFY